MFGKKKNKNDKITKQQEFGLKLIASISANVSKIAEETDSCPRSQYAFEVEKVLEDMKNNLLPALDHVKINNSLPFEDMEEVEIYG